ncbi:hypothetical protein PVAP13_6KG308106 [Panicum virgatum]|uniref:Uncharacterized protein n=1 Tax=Panicum virgatum TaxID=38727 RepID=A0A8T0RH74_PANVG|nr:hypothetical protein PVAP13_6KG308106 [Panicum virgatum]
MCQPEEDGGEAGRFWTKRAAAASRARGSREGARRRRAGRATARIQPPAGSAGAHMTRASGRSNQRRNERARKAWPRGARLPESRGPDQTDGVSRCARQAVRERASARPHSPGSQEQKRAAVAVQELLKAEAERQRRAKAAARKRKPTGVLLCCRSRSGRRRGELRQRPAFALACAGRWLRLLCASVLACASLCGNTHLWHPNGRFLVPGRLRRRPGTFMRAAPSSARASLICPDAPTTCECASAPAATNQLGVGAERGDAPRIQASPPQPGCQR